MSQQIILRPLGIATSPNKLGSMPAGALSKALNAWMRVPGVIESSKTWVQRRTVAAFSGIANPTSFLYDFAEAGITNNTLMVFQAAGGIWECAFLFIPGSGVTPWPFANELVNMFPHIAGYSRVVSVGSHAMINCELGHLAFDSIIIPDNAAPREAGLYPPNVIFSFINSSQNDVGAIARSTHCHSTAVFRRIYSQFSGFESDSYEMVSAPTVASHTYGPTTGSAVGFATIRHEIRFEPATAKAGDLVEVYRTRSQIYDSTTPPLQYVNTGSDYYLAVSAYLTSADIASNAVTLIDNTQDTALGQALYTNDGLQGAESAALPPPTSLAMCMFKNHAHFFNTLSAPFMKIQSSYNWGVIPGALSADIRLQSFGGLGTTFTATNGSATLTGISAAHMNGLAIGQVLDDATGFPGGAGAIVSVGVNSVVVDVPYTGTSGSFSRFFMDTITINGARFRASNPSEFASALGLGGIGSWTVAGLSFVVPPIVSVLNYPFTTTPADYITITKRDIWGNYDPAKLTFSVSASRGFLLDPKLPNTSSGQVKVFTAETDFNGWMWSEKGQPENVPITNQDFVGSGSIYGAIATRDCIWVSASDGLWRISGTGGQAGAGYDWRCDPVDSTLFFASPQSFCVLRDVVYAYTNRGFVAIYPDGSVNNISQGRLDDVMPGSQFIAFDIDPAFVTLCIADVEKDEVIIRVRNSAAGVVWRYNVDMDAFTQEQVGATLVGGAYCLSDEGVCLTRTANGGEIIGPSSGTYAAMDIEFQPLYADNPFVQRHWQNVNVAVEDITDNVTVKTNGLTAGTRALTPGGASINSRQAFSVPRNAPAISNNLQVAVTFASDDQSAKLQGVSIDYEDITTQRKVR